MQSKRKANSLQKNRRQTLEEFVSIMITTCQNKIGTKIKLLKFETILNIFQNEKFGLIHSFKTKNESYIEYYEILFEILFHKLMNEKFINGIIIFFLIYICIDTAPKFYDLYIFLDIERVRFFLTFLE